MRTAYKGKKWGKVLVPAVLVVLGVLFVFASASLGGPKLHTAAYNGDIEQVRSILAHGGQGLDVDERDSFGGTALHAAMFQRDMNIVELLIAAGLDVNAQGTSNGYTPLHDAVWDNNVEAAKILLRHGARVDIRGNDGTTPYEKARKEGKLELANILAQADN